MSASVLPLRRPTSMMAHPEGAPDGLSTDPMQLSALALGLADLCGEPCEFLTPERHDLYRQAVLLAAWLAHPEARLLVSGHVARHVEPFIHDADAKTRSGLVWRVCAGLRAAMAAVHGLQPSKHAAVVALAAHDHQAARERRKAGGW